MKPRHRTPFCPVGPPLIGMDLLEDRQLLSTIAYVADVADVAELERSGATSQATASEAPDVSGVVASLSSAINPGSTIRTVSGTSASIPLLASSGSGVPGAVETTPADELVTGSSSEPSINEQPGDVALAIGTVEVPANQTVGMPNNLSPAALSSSSLSWSGTTTPPQGSSNPSGLGAWVDGTFLSFLGIAIQSGFTTDEPVTPTTDHDHNAPSERVTNEGHERGTCEQPSTFPAFADLLTDLAPSDHKSLEHAIDHFLAPIDATVDRLTTRPSISWLTATTAIVAATVASEVIRRRIRGDEPETRASDPELAWHPDHPDFWRLEGT